MANYLAAAVMDVVIACTGLGLSLLVARSQSFQVEHFYSWLALLFAVVGLGTAVGSIFLSRLSDRFGRKPMLLISVAGIMVSSLFLGVSFKWWHLFAVMPFRSCFIGIYWPSLEARITDGAAGREMTRRLGLFGISFCLGLLVGHPLCGFLSDQWLRAPLYAAAGLCLVLFVFLWITFRSDGAYDGHRPAARREAGPAAAAGGNRGLARAFVLSAWIANALSYAVAAVLRGIFPRFATLPLAQGGLAFSGFETGSIVAGSNVGMLLMFLVFGKYHFWHYRFRYLVFAQALALLGCLAFSTCSGAGALFAGSLLFGFGSGIVYISSIYYSLEGEGDRAGQSGLHEGILCFGYAGGMITTAVVTRFLASHRTPYWICVAVVAVGIAVQAVIWTRARMRGAG